jgi:hypothetical protein
MRVQRTNYEGSWDERCPHCGEKQLTHREVAGELDGVRYEHRMPCEAEKASITRQAQIQVRALKSILLLGWVLVPMIIAIAGFASFVVGLILLVISIFKIAWTAVELFGAPSKWFPSYESKKDKERKMRHYYYHCEKNPEGFRRLFIENLKNEDDA